MEHSNENVTVKSCHQSGHCNDCYFFKFLPDPSVLYPEDVKAVCTYDATILGTSLPNEDFQVEIPKCCPRRGMPLFLEHIML